MHLYLASCAACKKAMFRTVGGELKCTGAGELAKCSWCDACQMSIAAIYYLRSNSSCSAAALLLERSPPQSSNFVPDPPHYLPLVTMISSIASCHKNENVSWFSLHIKCLLLLTSLTTLGINSVNMVRQRQWEASSLASAASSAKPDVSQEGSEFISVSIIFYCLLLLQWSRRES